MLSKAGSLGDSVGHLCPHLMFHVPGTHDANWRADMAGSLVLFNNQFHWSDGTAAPHEAFD